MMAMISRFTFPGVYYNIFRLWTVMFSPLSILDGLLYLGMRPYTDVEHESLPYVILTSDGWGVMMSDESSVSQSNSLD
jgi:hypothetical protein